ncbi:MarR family winged helix-turn-helix transcriptional regulator [Cohnella yongneupensis]|uniref:MarR family winged helix-turn-helix transcriptional regulator n=1 Tax=Cohnella yongneupensis TaxID=425006 RepID=A0ABW0R2F8_9BACL
MGRLTDETNKRDDVQEDQALSLKLLVVLSKAYKSVMDKAARDVKNYDLSLSEFGILEVLYAKGQIPIQQIGGKVLVTSGTMTYNIDKLEQKGFVKRIPCPTDRRVINASLTDAGQSLLDRIFPLHAQGIERIMQGLTTEQKQQAIELLKWLGKGAKQQ